MTGAVFGNQILVLEYLLDKGADPDIQNIYGNYVFKEVLFVRLSLKLCKIDMF